ncbi:MAG: UDP-3-O-acyl-N-acetylglucosamine deacetylase [Alphaproteobacteria bacterium]
MSIVWQNTLKTAISCKGIGLHGGRRVQMTLLPAAPGTGIQFRRTDLDGELIEARHDNVSDTLLSTSLDNRDGRGVATIEHLMAAFAGLGIDNVLVELDDCEVPAMDGSAAPFVFLAECAGIAEQQAPRNAIEVLKTVTVTDGDSQISLSPASGFSISFEISFDHPVIADQSCYIELEDGVFKRELARARTFGFLSDINKLRERGLGLGGSLDNAVVLSQDGVMNAGGLRFLDEFVRHKALDCIGDLYLAGAPLIGHVQCVRSGHSTNHLLLDALFADDSTWRYVVLDGKHLAGAAAERWRAASVAAPA